jgi:hypothetical protein
MTVDQALKGMDNVIVLPAGLEGVREVEEHVAVLYLSRAA